MTKQIRKASAAQEKFEQARRNWLGPDLTDEEAHRLIAATKAETARREAARKV